MEVYHPGSGDKTHNKTHKCSNQSWDCGWLGEQRAQTMCLIVLLLRTISHCQADSFQNEESALQEAQDHQLRAQPWSVPWDELMGVICEELPAPHCK